MIPEFEDAQSLLDAAPCKLAASEWLKVEQPRVNLFADATDDQQWIHVDPERAVDGPFGTTIAHGFLTLSLVNRFLPQIVHVKTKMGINYGCDRVRFPSPVRVGERIRGVGELMEAQPIDGGVQAKIRITVEIEGADKPACVADTISRFYFE